MFSQFQRARWGLLCALLLTPVNLLAQTPNEVTQNNPTQAQTTTESSNVEQVNPSPAPENSNAAASTDATTKDSATTGVAVTAAEKPEESQNAEVKAPTVIEPLDPWYHFKGLKNPNPEEAAAKKAAEEKLEAEAKTQAAVDTEKTAAEAPLEKVKEEAAKIEKKKEEESIEHILNFGEEGEDGFFEDTDEAYIEEQAGNALERSVSLTKEQAMRVSRVQKNYLKRVASQRSLQRKAATADARGEVELRVCSVNLNNYGAQAEVARILRAAGTRARRVKEKSIVAAVAKLDCDVIAVQAALGATVSAARAGLRELGAKIQEQTGGHWEAFVGASNHKLCYNAYLVNLDRATVMGTTTHTDKFLPRFGIFEEANFVRAPYEIILDVESRDGSGSKEVVITNFQFQRSMSLGKPEQESMKMQMAEAVRQIVELGQFRLDTRGGSIAVVTGDRVNGREMPSSLILEGRLQLTDFKGDDPCKLAVTSRHVCDPFPSRAKILFGVLGESIKPPVIEKQEFKKAKPVKKIKGKKKQRKKSPAAQQIDRTNEIYFLQKDLPKVQKEANVSGIYSAGGIDVDNGLPDSPLLWVDLNW